MEIVQVEENPTQPLPPTRVQRVTNPWTMTNPHYLLQSDKPALAFRCALNSIMSPSHLVTL